MKKSVKIPKGGNHSPYIEEDQTIQWPKQKVQRDKQRSIKHTYKTKVRITRTSLKPGGVLRCSGKVSSSKCSVHNVILESPSSFTLRVKYMKVKLFKSLWEQENETA